MSTTLVRDTIELTRNMLTSRHVTLRTQLAPTLPPIAGDRVQLQQLVLNLIVNAADAMDDLAEAERVLTISTALRAGAVSLCVADRGPGVAAEAHGQTVRALLEHQGRWHGHGPGDLPFHRRSAPWQPGRNERA